MKLFPLAVALAAASAAGQVQLVRDLNRAGSSNPDSNPQIAVSLGSWTYFTSATNVYGRELFRTQGTPATTQLFADITPGPSNGNPEGATVVGTNVLFAAQDPAHGRELWRTDGTTTSLVTDILPGPGSSNPTELQELGGILLFGAETTPGTRRLLRSDGNASTTKIADVDPVDMHRAGGLVWFQDSGRTSLWRSDGTTSGTFEVQVGLAAAADPIRVVELGGQNYFLACTGPTSRALFQSDGSANGTQVLATLPTTLCVLSNAPVLGVYGGRIWFMGAPNGLWASDGTTAGTQLVKQFSQAINLTDLVVLGSEMFLVSRGLINSGLWKSDGTAAGTTILVALRNLTNLRRLGNRLWFACEENGGNEPWVSDGSVAGTTRVADLNSGVDSSDPAEFTDLPGGGVLFTADDGNSGRELYIAQGNPLGVSLLHDGLQVQNFGSLARPLGGLQGKLFFAGSDGIRGNELWMTDGTSAGTVLLKDLQPGSSGSYPSGGVVVDGKLFARAIFNGRYQLIESDGTPAGTRTTGFEVGNSGLFAAGRNLYFRAPDAGGISLFVYDTKTQVRTKLRRFPIASDWANEYCWVAGTVYFVGYDASRGYEIWKTNGTPSGTLLIGELVPGSRHERPADLTEWNGKVLFRGPISTGGTSLWVTDGQLSGTKLVGLTSANPRDLIRTEQGVFFLADEGRSTYLHITDGTAAGTQLISRQTRPTAIGIPFQGGLLFPGFEATSGVEPWFSDGTAANTRRVADTTPGAGLGTVGTTMRALGSRFAGFLVDNPTFGSELWVTDGTSGGTQIVRDLNPGIPSGVTDLESAVFTGGKLFFTGQDGQLGKELYSAFLGASAQPVGRSCGPNPNRLTATAPILGATMEVVASESPVVPGLLLVGAGPGLDLDDCYLSVPNPVAFLPVTGPGWRKQFSIPNVASSIGTQVIIQTAYAASARPIGFVLSNAVALTTGR